MSEPRRVRPAWLDTLVLGSATAALVVAATLVMFSAFMLYDDEGYILLSLRNYAAHGALYRDVYSQYGPFPFVFYHAVQWLGVELTHTAGRLITVAAWTGAAIGCAALSGVATRSLLMRVSVLAAVFLYLWVMAREPTHPGGLIVAATALLAVLGYKWIVEGKTGRWAVLVGAGTAMLFLTKVNVGGFAAFTAVSWWLLHHRDERLRRWSTAIVGFAAVLMVFGLMRPLLGTPWVLTYAVLFSVAGVTSATAIATGTSGQTGWTDLRRGLIAGTIVASVVLGCVLLLGSGIIDLLHGLILGPLRQPVAFTLRFVWPAGIHFLAAASLAGCAAAFILRHRFRSRIDSAVAAARLVATFAVAAQMLRFPAVSPDLPIFGAALPSLWLFAWPLTGEESRSRAGRSWLILLLLGQYLHAFPVPGSQIAWGTFLIVPLAAIGAWDAGRWLASHACPPLHHRKVRQMGAAATLAFTALVGWKFGHLAARYREGENLGLPGAELIRVPAGTAALCRMLAHNAAVHADVLFSLPGMFSFNLWTGRPTPTLANVTHWFSLLNDTQQQAIANDLELHPDAAVIIWRDHLQFLRNRNVRPGGVLFEYIEREFESVFSIDTVEFCVRRGRRIRPFLLGEHLVRSSSTATPAIESALLTFSLLLPPARPIAEILISTGVEGGRQLKLDATSARAEKAPLDARGELVGPREPLPWPLHVRGSTQLWIYYNAENPPHPTRAATFILKDANGAEVGLGRIAAP